ncbi:MFS transporter [Microbacterium sp. JZ37]|uniref:MFS transporter n=1 Tax=Microbacterium sp. JZ37 TaxID=2654193 RepID=UPI002B47990B|nr:MFS transporter [Microbacterium sp. JZ37]WRH17889.1 MFS transporter [Microbacterium sp. JZ37]
MTISDVRESRSLLRIAGLPYFLIALVARLPFAMMVVGVLTAVVSVRGSLALGGLTSATVGLGTACFGALLGAAADAFGQRRVLLLLAAANAAALALFAAVVYGDTPDGLVLAAAFGIGATAPQVAPLSRARLVTLIRHRMAPDRAPRTLSSTMAYESAADETVFVIGPFIVGLLAAAIAPWAPLVGAAALTAVFVGAFALHPTGRLVAPGREDGAAPSSDVRELFRPRVLVVVGGTLGVGLFFGSMLTSLTSFMADRGRADEAGLMYGVMGIGSALFALGIAYLPARFSLAARWIAFASVLLAGSLSLLLAASPGAMACSLAVIGIGIGPTLVTQYSLAAARSPEGRSATVMTMVGSAVVVGQAMASALTGSVSETFGTSAALLLPIAAAALVLIAAIANAVLSRPRA